jgi:hypothetical protein
LFLLTGAKPCKFTIESPEYALIMDATYGPDFLTFQKAVTKTTEAFPLNSVMSPGTYQISPETVFRSSKKEQKCITVVYRLPNPGHPADSCISSINISIYFVILIRVSIIVKNILFSDDFIKANIRT